MGSFPISQVLPVPRPELIHCERDDIMVPDCVGLEIMG